MFHTYNKMHLNDFYRRGTPSPPPSLSPPHFSFPSTVK